MLPSTEQLKNPPTNEEKAKLDKFILELFDDVETNKVTAIIVHAFGALMNIDFRRAYATASTLNERCEEIIEEQLLERLKANPLSGLLVALVRSGRDNS